MPCLSTLAPWQPYFFGRGGDPRVRVRLDVPLLLGRRPARRRVHRDVGVRRHEQGGRPAVRQRPRRQRPRRPRDRASPQVPRPPATRSSTPADSSRCPTTSRRIISEFKDGEVEIVVGIPLPPDFATFWTQAQAAGLQPEARDDGQGDPVPVGRRGARRHRRRPGQRDLVDADAPVRQLADRRSPPRTCPTSTRRRPASSGRSSSASCTRCSSTPSTSSAAPAAPTSKRSPTLPRPPSSTPSSARCASAPTGRAQEHLHDVARRRSVAADRRRRVPLRPRGHAQRAVTGDPPDGRVEPLA